MADAGRACAAHHDANVRNVRASCIQADEAWSFCYAKAKNVPYAKKAPEGAGDVWTWTAIDTDSKLIVSYMVGDRSGAMATAFMKDLRGRLANRVQLTTDGHKPYLDAVEDAFGDDVDFAQLVKHFSEDEESDDSPVDVAVEKRAVTGAPEAGVHLHQLRGAEQPDPADGQPPLHPPDQCVLEADREALPDAEPVPLLLQLGADPLEHQVHAGDGGRTDEDPARHGVDRGADRGVGPCVISISHYMGSSATLTSETRRGFLKLAACNRPPEKGEVLSGRPENGRIINGYRRDTDHGGGRLASQPDCGGHMDRGVRTTRTGDRRGVPRRDPPA